LDRAPSVGVGQLKGIDLLLDATADGTVRHPSSPPPTMKTPVSTTILMALLLCTVLMLTGVTAKERSHGASKGKQTAVNHPAPATPCIRTLACFSL